MITLVTVSIAAPACVAAVNRLHNRIGSIHERINHLDRRLDVELTVATDYVSKADLAGLLSAWKITWYVSKIN